MRHGRQASTIAMVLGAPAWLSPEAILPIASPGAHGLLRVGVRWLGGSCRGCPDCLRGREKSCEAAVFTADHRHGGFAGYAVADERYC